VVNYEAQAAIELEALADSSEPGAYRFEIRSQAEKESGQFRSSFLIDPTPVIREIVSDLQRGVHTGIISARFHNSVAQMVLEVSVAIRHSTGINKVALSGGVWQNLFLLQKSFQLLTNHGFSVLIHNQVPANDGGLALGQAVYAAYQMKSGCNPSSLNLPSPGNSIRNP
jgi:hydrogenase maturation protein HypF